MFNRDPIEEGQVYHLYSRDIAKLIDCDTGSVDVLMGSLPFSSDDTRHGQRQSSWPLSLAEKMMLICL